MVRYAKSGEARFQGARRVENLSSYSQTIDNIAWSKNSVTVSGTKVAYADGSLIGQTMVSAATTALHYIGNGTASILA